ncbi:MAG TPA: hypothetical protein P5531_02510 [Bacteroidales bacterium]|nr:hypothetical protein [Bacteroidales bacterium]HSA43166.1 hypothetical protein [Bacteroidales bacterium]
MRLSGLLFCLLAVIISLPLIQGIFPYISSKPLAGAVNTAEAPEFSFKSWVSRDFQRQAEPFLQQATGFYPDLVRLNNQLDYSIFNRVHAKDVIIGKDHYLYEQNYIADYTGRNFIGDTAAEARLSALKFIQDSLSEHGTGLLILFLPGKASFYPEYIPDELLKEKTGISNYKYLSEGCKRHGINYIDFNRYFLAMKDTASWPLYPRYGIHWSIYGMGICTDSLFRYISHNLGIRMHDFGWDGLDITADLRDTDYDVGEGLNLIWKMKNTPGAYPRFYHRQVENAVKPDVLVIADSFFWMIYGNGLTTPMFGKHDFWYYFEQSIAANRPLSSYTDQELKTETESYDLIILMSTEANLYKFPFGFSDRLRPCYP